MKYTGVRSPYENIISVPEECEIALRTKGEKAYLFVLNYSENTVGIDILKEVTDMDHGLLVKGKDEMRPYETRVFDVTNVLNARAV